MGAAIIPFDFETNAVRVVMVGDAPWFVAADVCRVLEHSNSRVALKRLDDDEKGVSKVYTLGGEQEMNIISESGLYTLIVTSNIPAAKRFRKWVTAEVLPSIRRDGSYSLPAADRAELEEKRAYYRALPQVHRDRAEARVAALERFEARVESGEPTTRALRAVAAEAGFSERSLWGYRRNVRMVHRSDRAAALAPLWNLPKGPRVECHPEALRMFLDLASRPSRITDCYRRMTEEAARRGWSPIPSERTLRRVAAQVVPRLSGPRPA